MSTMTAFEVARVLEAVIVSADEPVSIEKMSRLFEEQGKPPGKRVLREALELLSLECQGRSTELKETASGYRYQVRQDYAGWVSKLWDERAPRYSRALLETLALIAYRQPVTRGDIEDVRGVAVSSNIIKTLLERGWVQVIGHREVPGRPALYATTKGFLDYFNLKTLDELPSLKELQNLDSLHPELVLPNPDEALTVQVPGDNTQGDERLEPPSTDA